MTCSSNCQSLYFLLLLLLLFLQGERQRVVPAAGATVGRGARPALALGPALAAKAWSIIDRRSMVFLLLSIFKTCTMECRITAIRSTSARAGHGMLIGIALVWTQARAEILEQFPATSKRAQISSCLESKFLDLRGVMAPVRPHLPTAVSYAQHHFGGESVRKMLPCAGTVRVTALTAPSSLPLQTSVACAAAPSASRLRGVTIAGSPLL